MKYILICMLLALFSEFILLSYIKKNRVCNELSKSLQLT